MPLPSAKSSLVKAKHQRLILGVLALCAIIGAGLFGASALRTEAAYFYTPARMVAAKPDVGQPLRLGGMVAKGSLSRATDGVSVYFLATDGKVNVPVRYTGILPDLFREGSGMVADGHMGKDGAFVADRILAKHDERYMPPSVAKDMENTGSTIRASDDIAKPVVAPAGNQTNNQ
jgi:cytochrome c-type biogenesis protein CcmE